MVLEKTFKSALGEGGKIWENGIETHKISCMKRVPSPGSMHDTGCLGLVHWETSDFSNPACMSENSQFPYCSSLA